MNHRALAREIDFTKVTDKDIERFFGYVDFQNCWTWQGGRSGDYGSFSFAGEAYWPHRFSYFIFHDMRHNPTLTIDHLCRNTLCVNPDHLELVPKGVNTLRSKSASALNKLKLCCIRGHMFDDANTGRDTRGDRYCKICRSNYGRARYHSLQM